MATEQQPVAAPGVDGPTPSEGSAPPADGSTIPSNGDSRQEGFRTGYAKGVEKGVRDAATTTLQTLGFVDLESATAELARLRDAPKEPLKEPGVPVQDMPEYRQLAAEQLRLTSERDQLKATVNGLSVRADEARLEKLRGASRAKGVGEPQMAAMVALYGDRVQLGDDGQLEVLSKMPDGTMVMANQTTDAFFDEVLKDNQWLLAPQQPRGAGSNVQGTSGGDTGPRSILEPDRRPLRERLKDRQ